MSRVDVADRQPAAGVEDEAELRRQRAQRLVRGEARFERGDVGGEIERGGGVDVAQGADENVAQTLDLGVRVDEAGHVETRLQVGQRPLADAAQLQIAARREADRAVAAGERGLGDRGSLIEREAPARGPHPHEQAVAGLHRPKGARDTSPCGAAQSRSCGLPRSDARTLAAELRRERQKPRRAASSNTPRHVARRRTVGADEKRPHLIVAERRVEHEVELLAADGVGQGGEGVEIVERLGDLGRAAMAVAHLAGEPARIGGAAAKRRGRSPARADGSSASPAPLESR